MKKLYAAYGSNLDLSQMALRCPEAKVYGIGVLKDYRLIYRGLTANSYATIEECAGCYVPIGLWEISKSDENNLDIYEGFPRFYVKKTLTITTEKEDVEAMCYIMNKKAKPGLPNSRYISTIRNGYNDFNLDIKLLIDSLKYNVKEVYDL